MLKEFLCAFWSCNLQSCCVARNGQINGKEIVSNDYKEDKAVRTMIAGERTSERLSLTIDRREMNGFKGDARNFVIEIPGEAKPASVLVNGEKIRSTKKQQLLESIDKKFDVISWNYDKEAQKVTLRIPAGAQSSINIQIML